MTNQEGFPYEPDETLAAINQVIQTFGGEALGVSEEKAAMSSEALPEHYSLSDIKENVFGRLEASYTQLRMRAESSSAGTEHSSLSTAAELLEILIDKAAADGDAGRIDEYVSTFEALRAQEGEEDPYKYEFNERLGAKIYGRAAVRGNESAFDKLHQCLDREKATLASKEDHISRYLQLQADRLASTVRLFAEEGFPAGRLIDEYTTTPYQRITQYIRYARICREDNAPQEVIDAAEKAMRDAFMQLPDYLVEVVFSPPLIDQVRNEAYRGDMFERYGNAEDGPVPKVIFLAADALESMLSIPPSAATPRTKAHLRTLADAISSDLGPAFTTMMIDVAIAQGASPAEAIDATRRLATTDEYRNSSELGRQTVLRDQDTLFAKYAQRYAEHGDFEAAQTFMQAISSPYVAVRTIMQCMPFAKTANQRAHLQADTLQQSLYPELPLSWQIMNAAASQDTNALATATRDFVRSTPTYADSSGRVRAVDVPQDGFLLAHAFENMPPERAVSLAKELKAELVAAGEQSGLGQEKRRQIMLKRLSGILANLGDLDQIREKHADAHATYADAENIESKKEAGYLELAKLLLSRSA
jgi:hypothetical protein